MENHYCVGIGNRYALFLEEGENSLTAIKKKINKETRRKDKQDKKEVAADAKKVEPVKTPEKPKKPAETNPATANNEVTPKKEIKEKKPDSAKGKEKKVNDNAKRKEKDSQDRSRNNKSNESSPVENDVKEKDSNKPNESSGNARKTNYERKPPRDRKFDNDQFQSKSSPPSNKKFNKDDWNDKDANTDSTAERYQNDDNRNIRENGHGPYNDSKPRGGGRFNKGNRGGRNTYGGGDRRKEYDNSFENKEEFDTNKNESNGEEKAEEDPENADNQKDGENKTGDGEGENSEQKEVKEFLTLDEWKKLKGTRQKPQYNLRKAGEGEDLTQWKNMRELQKKKDEEFLKNGGVPANNVSGNEAEESQEAANENVQRVARQKHIDINVHFRDAPVRGRGGRVIRSNRFGYKGANFDHNENFGGENRPPFRRNRDNRDRDGNREGGHREGGHREGGYREGGHREGGHREGGHREHRDHRDRDGGHRDGPPRGNRQHAPKMDDEKTFPSLG